jgi:hypothetical protein
MGPRQWWSQIDEQPKIDFSLNGDTFVKTIKIVATWHMSRMLF